MLAADLIFMWSSSVAGDLLQAFFPLINRVNVEIGMGDLGRWLWYFVRGQKCRDTEE